MLFVVPSMSYVWMPVCLPLTGLYLLAPIVIGTLVLWFRMDLNGFLSFLSTVVLTFSNFTVL